MASKFCKKCGQTLPEGATFCPNCGTKAKEEEKTPSRVESFQVNEVILSEMLATVNITVGETSKVKVTIEGDEESKKGAMLDVSGNSLKISAPLPFAEGSSNAGYGGPFFSGNSVVSIGSVSSGMSIINGQVMYNGRVVDMMRTLQITVEVPQGTDVKVGKLIGKARIGNTQGDLTLNIHGTTKVSAGKIRNLSVSISGSGDAEVSEINGSIDAKVSGTGNITIHGGTASTFGASVSGTGSISFNGVAQTANLGVSGVGNIYLAECLSTAQKRRSGVGSIRVGREPQQKSGFADW